MSYYVVSPPETKFGIYQETEYGNNYSPPSNILPFNAGESFSFPVAYQSTEEIPIHAFGLGKSLNKLKRQVDEGEFDIYMQNDMFLSSLLNESYIKHGKPVKSFSLIRKEGNNVFISYGSYITEYSLLAEDGYFIREKMKMKCSHTKKYTGLYSSLGTSSNTVPSNKLFLKLKINENYIDLPFLEKVSLNIIPSLIEGLMWGGTKCMNPILGQYKFELKLNTFFIDLVGSNSSPVNRINGILLPDSSAEYVNLSDRKYSFRLQINIQTGLTPTLILDNLYLNTNTVKETVMDGLKKFELSFTSGIDTAFSYST